MAWTALRTTVERDDDEYSPYTVRVWQIEAVEGNIAAGSDREGYETRYAGQFVARITDGEGNAYDERDGFDYNGWIAPYASLHQTADAALAEGVAAVRDAPADPTSM